MVHICIYINYIQIYYNRYKLTSELLGDVSKRGMKRNIAHRSFHVARFSRHGIPAFSSQVISSVNVAERSLSPFAQQHHATSNQQLGRLCFETWMNTCSRLLPYGIGVLPYSRYNGYKYCFVCMPSERTAKHG